MKEIWITLLGVAIGAVAFNIDRANAYLKRVRESMEEG